MPALATPLRKDLEKAVIQARKVAEQGAAASLIALGYADADKPGHLSADDAALRTALRARGRQLGEAKGETGVQQGQQPLTGEIAYEQWHRMLFARFLAENGLLRHPEGASLTIEMCAELAPDEGARDGWDLAARYAGAMLPGLFRASDPAVRVRLAREHYLALEELVEGLPEDVFSSDDGLGWVYQFWQTERKKQVNAEAKSRGTKIGAAELPAVTQLFTEPYMVDFLLQNTLGAWWAGKYPDSPLLGDMPYLRYGDDGRPAAGTFDGWAKTVRELKVLDPCCGSGHFLVAAFGWLRRMREVEDGLSEGDAADAVLRDNLFGLELDRRCTQIAMFNVALAAWRVGGQPEHNVPQVACSGTPIKGDADQWAKLARVRDAWDASGQAEFIRDVYREFSEAPVLGSLIDPKSLRRVNQNNLRPKNDEALTKLLRQALDRFGNVDDEFGLFADSAGEVARAYEMLDGRYDLIMTNVPYLSRASQAPSLREHADRWHSAAKADLATIFLERCLSLGESGGTVAAVTPQNWLFLGAYRKLREDLLVARTLDAIARLGTSAFETVSGEVVNVALVALTARGPLPTATFAGINVSEGKGPVDKDRLLRGQPVLAVSQAAQVENPDGRIVLEVSHGVTLLSNYAHSYIGILTGDYVRFGRTFWELASLNDRWSYQQSTFRADDVNAGRENVLLWEDGRGELRKLATILKTRLHDADRRGNAAWGKRGVIVSQFGTLPARLYAGDLFDNNVSVIIPNSSDQLAAIWAFASSEEFNKSVRRIDQSMAVTNATLVKVPFDLDYWQKVAYEKYPDGLPEPHSDYPTQWLFAGHPKGSDDPLHVALSRLLGYRWPDQLEDDHGLREYTDPDGIVCLPAVAGEQPAHLRLRELLRAAWGDDWSGETVAELVAGAGLPGKTLEDWLLDDAFRQHCALFHNRPFLWHVWDGRKDGFSAIVNYHRLDAAVLDKLTYTYLGDWIGRQKQAVEASVPGADARWQAALALQRKLELIRQGEAPYDIYVRWKSLAQQPIGWEPDLNDGVRLNIRPFVEGGVLRTKFTVKWGKDRGANPEGADVYRWSEAAQRAAGIPVAEVNGKDRLNDLHLSLTTKQAAREEAKANPEVAAAPAGPRTLLD